MYESKRESWSAEWTEDMGLGEGERGKRKGGPGNAPSVVINLAEEIESETELS